MLFQQRSIRPSKFIFHHIVLVFVMVFAGLGIQPEINVKAETGAFTTLPVDINSSEFFAPFQLPVAGVSLSVPANIQIGQAFSFTATFDNTDPADVGYGPFIDVYFPVTGVDGAGAGIDDGIDFVSASYPGGSIATTPQTFPAAPLGVAPCGATQSSVLHPYAVDATGAFVVVCGTPGDKVVTFQLPFGSFTPNQTPAVVTINAVLSNLADVNTALSLRVRGGYQYGMTPLNDWCCGDPSIVSQGSDTSTWPATPISPVLLTLTKTYSGPENETATGPNYTRQYTLDVDIATGQPVTSLIVTDTFPNNMQFVSVASAVPAATCTTIPSPLSTPGGALSCDFGAVTGGAGLDATVVINFYIPLNDLNVDPVIVATTGDDVISNNTSGASGSWDPLDSRDAITALSTSAVCPTDCPSLNDRSIAIQKSVATAIDVGVVGNSPGDTLEYTLEFQISDFFSFQDVVLTDVLSDGQRVDLTFTPTLQVDGNGFTLGVAGMAGANYTIDNVQIGSSGPNPPPDGTDGTQTIIFRASDELITRGQTGKLIGGCIQVAGTGGPVPSCGTYNDGTTNGAIIFRAIIQDQFTDTYPSGDASVDHGDLLTNDVTIIGNLLSVVDNSTLTGSSEADTSSTGISIAFGVLEKSVYAINGTVCPSAVVCPAVGLAGQYVIKPGDLITYRIQYDQPSSDFEQTVLTDYLPLPIFKAEDPEDDGGVATVWTQDGTLATTPPAGQWKYGPADTAHLKSVPVPAPTTSTSATDNTLSFTYAPYDDPLNNTSAIDLLFTVTVASEPFTDQLFLTNQLTVTEGTTNAGSQTLNAIVQVILTEPVLTTQKSIVSSSDDPPSGDAAYSPGLAGSPIFNQPGTVGLRWSPGSILSSGAVSDSNISNVDAGDLVTFAIFVENSGTSVTGAFDIMIRDTLQPGYVIPGGVAGLNLDVRRGDGSVVAFTDLGGGIFGTGIEITDPGLGVGACEYGAVGNGRNVIVITYDLQVDISFTGGTIINTGTLFNYAGIEGGDDHTNPLDISDAASTTIINPPVKSVITSSEASTVETGVGTTANPRLATIGEIVHYRISVQIPEGTTNNFRIRDTIPAGMSFLNDTNTVSVAFISDQGTCGLNISSSTLGTVPGLCGSTVLAPVFPLDFSTIAHDEAVSVTDSTAIANYPANNNDTYNNGTDTYFKVGNITNDDRDFNNEYIVIEFNVIVRNESANVTGANLDNTAIYRTGSSSTNSATSNTTRARVVEPAITFSKTIFSLPSVFDAGGQVTYRITVANGTGANVSTAFELVVLDTLPNALTLNTLPGSVVVTPLTGTVGAVDFLTNTAINSPPSTPSSLDVRIASLAPNSSVQIDYTATINSSITPGEIITNLGVVTWTSLPGANGTTGNSTGSNTPGVSGAVTGERNGSNGPAGTPNNYALNSSQTFTAAPFVPVKSILSTSEAHTAETGDGSLGNPRDLAIGEIIRYRLSVQLPEGTTTSLSLVDTLPAGFTFLNDGETRISFIADTDMTEEADLAAADNDTLPATFVMPTARIGVVGQDVTFTVADLVTAGDMVNNDSDINNEYVVIDFNVIVNNDANSNNTDLDSNDFNVVVSGTTVSTSNSVGTRIVEPLLTITKSVSDEHPAPGQVVIFTLVITNTGTATAYDVQITDGIPSELSLDLGSITVTPFGTTTVINNSSTASQVNITAGSINTGGGITITYEATVTALINNIFVNNAETKWTSLPGTNGTLVNSTGNSTPGSPGTGTGERDGSGGVNDYVNVAQVTLTADRNLEKNLVSSNVSSTTFPDDVTIGEILTYEIILTIPAGSTDTAIITDTLDSGLAFVDVVSFVYSNEDTDGAGVADTGVYFSGSATPVIGVGAQTIIFNLDNIVNTALIPETITITYRVIVLNIMANVQGVTLDNDVDFSWSAGTLSTRAIPSVEIVEPHLEIEKTVDPIAASLGSVVTFGISIDHTLDSLTTAYDVIVMDNIPTGLILNESSVLVATTGGPTGQVILTTPTSITVRWASFPLGATAIITFEAVFSGPAPVFNSSNVEWSTLQIDPAPRFVPQSSYNTDSTERRYDPLALAGPNNYVTSSEVRLSTPPRLPRTGFAPGEVTALPAKPSNFEYSALGDLWIEIPRLGVKLDIVGVPLSQTEWNLTWLGNQAGYLEGTAYPTHSGNTGITAHAFLADGTPGPFVNMDNLQYGDQIIIHLGGQKYIYEVREERRVRPESVASVLKHEELSWLTLITCKSYNETTGEYVYRSVVRAVLIKVVDE